MKNRILLSFLCGLILPVASNAADIYWVSFHPGDDQPSAAAAAAGFTQAPDAGYTELLRNNGYNVIRVVSTGSPDVNLLNTAGLVIISRSVPSSNFQNDSSTAAWNGITAPTMILGGYILRNSRLGYTTGSTIPDTTGTVTLQINDPSHPIFDGIPLSSNNVMLTPFATSLSFNGTVQRGISVNTDPVADNGKILATVATTGDPAFGGMIIGEWDAGAKMATSPVDTLGGHRLVFLTGSREQTSGLTSEGAGIYDLTADGSKLFLNSVAYMIIPEPSILALLALAGTGFWVLRRRLR